jgi:hypothetical protein
MLMPLDTLRRFFASMAPEVERGAAGEQQALRLLLDEINTRLR